MAVTTAALFQSTYVELREHIRTCRPCLAEMLLVAVGLMQNPDLPYRVQMCPEGERLLNQLVGVLA